MALTSPQRVALFGPLVTYPNGNKGTDPANLVTVTTPWGLKVRIHRLIEPRYLAACDRAARDCTWRPKRIDSFNPRPIRGSKAISLHALGLATDSFATPPNVVPPGGVWTPINGVPPDFARCFTDLGFRWGATFDRVDVPHIEWADGLPAPLTDAPPATFRGGTVILFHPKRPARVDHFYTGPQAQVLHKWTEGWPLAVNWVSEDLGGVIVRDLGAAWSADGNVVLLSGVGSDGRLYDKAWDGQAWTAWSKVGG